MLWVPHKGTLRSQSNFAPGSNSFGTAVTTGAAASTKGAVAELISSTNFDAYWVLVNVFNVGLNATLSRAAVDILVGAATEEVLIPNLLAGHAGTWGGANNGPKQWCFPLYIPAGTRITAQAAGDRTSVACNVQIFLFGGDGAPAFRVGTKVVTYGMGTVPGGTAFTPGTSGTWGAWAEVAASTSEDHFAVCPSWQLNTTTLSNRVLGLSIGIGAAAAERQMGEAYSFTSDANEFMGGPYNPMPIFQDIPAGSRLSIRGANNSTNDTGHNGVVHCVS